MMHFLASFISGRETGVTPAPDRVEIIADAHRSGRDQAARCGEILCISSAYSLRTHLPPRPASFPSPRPDGISGTFSSGWPGYRSAGRPSEAPATRRLTGFDASTEWDSGTEYTLAALLRP